MDFFPLNQFEIKGVGETCGFGQGLNQQAAGNVVLVGAVAFSLVEDKVVGRESLGAADGNDHAVFAALGVEGGERRRTAYPEWFA